MNLHPTILLRQALLANKGQQPPLNSDDTYTLMGRTLPSATSTCLKRTLAGGREERYYTIRDIVFFLSNSANLVEYRKNAVTAKVLAITTIDEQSVKDYFSGAAETCTLIDQIKLQQQIKEYATTASASASSSSSYSSSSAATSVSTSSSSSSANESAKRGYADMNTDSSAISSVDSSGTSIIDSSANSQQRNKLNALIGAPSHDRNSVLHIPGSDYSSVIKSFNENVLKYPASSSSEATAPGDSKRPRSQSEPDNKAASIQKPGSSSATSSGGGSASSEVVSVGPPIIIVPSAVTSAITMLNAVDFLQDAKYSSSSEKRKAGEVSEKEKSLYRKTPNGTVKYKVIDSPHLLKKEDWGRVVAAFVIGEAWQFKSWFLNKPAELFQKVLGIHLQIDGQIVPPDISTWNCKVIKVHPFHRHQDAIAYNQLWSYIDGFIKFNKPHLLHTSK